MIFFRARYCPNSCISPLFFHQCLPCPHSLMLMDCSRIRLSPASASFTRQDFALALFSRKNTASHLPRSRPPALTSSRDGSDQGEDSKRMSNPYVLAVEGLGSDESFESSFTEYLEKSAEMIRIADGGPPRWSSPLDCAARLDRSPLLLYLPGIIGLGTELSLQHKTLGKIFDIWCLHIPLTDRTSFGGLVEIVERTVRSEYKRSPKRPIYIIGESLGACLAMAVAARNPKINLLLVLANPATSFDRSTLNYLMKFCVNAMPDQLCEALTRLLNLVAGDSLKIPEISNRIRSVSRALSRGLKKDVVCMSSYVSELAKTITRETLLWKMEILKSASAYANSRLQCIKAKTLVIASRADELLPSEDEAKKLRKIIPRCEIRLFRGTGHQILLEKKIHLVAVMKATFFYQRGPFLDYVSDYILPTPDEFRDIYNFSNGLMQYTSPVLLSKMQNGRVVRGMAGVPIEGPVLYVGYHMLFGLDVLALVPRALYEENRLLRGLAHPLLFGRTKDGFLPPVSCFDILRSMGGLPVNEANFFKLMSSKAHVLLYPGGIREACHRKGEEYVLHWPEDAEFVRMAAKFGATIVPFGTVGEDDLFEVVVDYDDQMKIPMFREFYKSMAEEGVRLTRGAQTGGEVSKQEMHYPVARPKVPGRFYYLFGNPIRTKGRENDLRDKEKARDVYLQVKREVEDCLAFLKEKRESDPYRSLVVRLAYSALHGPFSQIPTFNL